MSPQPIPVNAEDFGLLAADIQIVRSDAGTELAGDAGAATPAGALLRAFALDAPTISAETTVAADESFDALLPAPQATRFHLELETAQQAGALLDVEVADAGALAPLPLPQCLTTDASGAQIAQTPAGGSSTFVVNVTETCGATQPLDVALHDGTRFVLQDAPTSIGPHETRTLTVLHPAAAAGEDVDLVLVSDSSAGLIVVSLHAVTP